MKNLLNKLQKAKAEIKATKLKKAGWNDYSKYSYFLPEQIEKLVHEACSKNSLFTKFDLIRNEFGETGKLTIYDMETGESLSYEMATAIPEIKATNVAQQLGGCVTYTERYLKMSAFGISENTLDFDTPQKEKTKEPTEWLNLTDKQGNATKQALALEKAIAEGQNFTLKGIRQKYKVSKQVQEQLFNKYKIK